MDLTLPGYNYLGPGNPLDKGEPTNQSDYVAQDHDHEYQRYIDAGLNPYLNFNEADQVAIDNFGNDIGGIIGRTVFTLKRTLANAGLIGHISLPPSMELTEDPTLVPNVKRPRTDETSEPITIVTVPRGSVTRPIIGRGAITTRRTTRGFKRRAYARTGRFKRYRRSYRRRYYRRRY